MIQLAVYMCVCDLKLVGLNGDPGFRGPKGDTGTGCS